jgi:hypothetical protein
VSLSPVSFIPVHECPLPVVSGLLMRHIPRMRLSVGKRYQAAIFVPSLQAAILR